LNTRAELQHLQGRQIQLQVLAAVRHPSYRQNHDKMHP